MTDTSLKTVSDALERGHLGRAGRILDKLRHTHAADPGMWLMSAAYHHQTGSRADALENLQTASTLALGRHKLRERIVYAYMNMQAWREAWELLEQLDPERQRYLLERARCLWGMGRYADSLARWRHFARAVPENPEVQGRLWQCYERLAMFAEADRQREVCAGWQGRDLNITMMELIHRVAENRLPEARALLDRADEALGAELQPLRNARHLLLRLPGAAELADPDPAPLPPLNANGEALLAGQQWLCRQSSTPPWYGNSTRMLVELVDRIKPKAQNGGLIMEFGVFHGRSINIISDRAAPAPVHGFDSFAGLPEAWSQTEAAGSYSTGGVLPDVRGNVTLHQGWFDELLDDFLQTHQGPVALAHIDCDLYRSTRDVLTRLAPRCQPGTLLLFDELIGYPGFEQHEMRAFREFLDDWPGGFELAGASFMGRAVAVQLS